MPQLIDLAQNRKLTIAGHYSLIITPIPERVWIERYFDKMFGVMRCGDHAEISADASSPLLDLLPEVAVSAEGYPQLARLAGAADWLSKIPLTHRLGYGAVLLGVSEMREPGQQAPPAFPLAQTHAVRIEAVWGDVTSCAMRRHRHLIHEFETPSKGQCERYQRASSQMRRTAAVRRAKATEFLAPEPGITAQVRAALYDELILKVEGYAVNGEPLSDDREKIIANMDTFHKVGAAGWLFSRVMSETEGRAA